MKAFVYQRHWICRDCSRGQAYPADREHDESGPEVCCFCGDPHAVDLARIAVLVAPKPGDLPLFPDRKASGSPAALRIVKGGRT